MSTCAFSLLGCNMGGSWFLETRKLSTKPQISLVQSSTYIIDTRRFAVVVVGFAIKEGVCVSENLLLTT